MEEFFQTYGVGIAAGVVLILVLYAILDYSGLFYSVKISTMKNPVGRLRVAYLYGEGPYQNCGSLFERVMKIAPHQRRMGIYYDDDTKQIPASQLRYMVGSILSENDDPVDKEKSEQFREDGFRFIEFPPIEEALATTFPFPWMISLYIAMWKVYPKLNKVAMEHGGKGGLAMPCLEIYEGKEIKYYIPTTNIDAYYVPEARDVPGKMKSS